MPKMTPANRALWGKRTGATAGLLGILCVLGELCFILPDLLVTKDALPFYQANKPFFQGLLQSCILITFALGAASVLMLRSKLHGLLGIGLASVALLMGGAQAEPMPVGRREFSAGLDYLVLELLVLGLIFVPLERLFTLRNQNIFRRGWQTDLKHFFVSHAGVQLLSFAAIVPVQMAFAWSTHMGFQKNVASQPLVLQFVEIVVIIDFMSYWVHRFFHKVPVLWNFHAIHHSSLHMDWLAGSRTHLVDTLVNRAAGFIPIFALGFASPAVYAYVVFASIHAVYLHSNIRWRWPYLRWVVATPEYHHWHHTSDEEGIDKNFAVLVPMWDVIFGTAYQPAHWPRKYGTVKFQPPDGWVGQLVYPFQRRGEETPYG